MARVFGYVMLTVTMIIFFNLAGITDLGSSLLGQWGINELGDGAGNFDSSSLVIAIVAGLTSLMVVVGASTLLFRADPSKAITAGLASTVLVTFIMQILAVANAAASLGADWMRPLIYAIAIPIVVGFIFSIYEWVIGQD